MGATPYTSGVNGLFGNTSMPTMGTAAPRLVSTDAIVFVDWKVKFGAYCFMQGIHEVVMNSFEDGLKLALEMDMSGRPAALIRQLFKSLHGRAYGAMVLAVESATGSSIFAEDSMTNPDANKLWVRLLDLYEKKTIHSALSLWTKLLALRYKDGENPMVLKKAFDSLIIQLNQIDDEIEPGGRVSEGFRACVWLTALPTSMVSTSQTLLTQQKVTPDEVYQTLVRRYESQGGSEMKIKLVGAEVAAAAVATAGSKGKFKHKNNNRKECNFCHKPGHQESDCYSKNGYPGQKKETDTQHSFCFVEANVFETLQHVDEDNEEDEDVCEEIAVVATEDGAEYVSSVMNLSSTQEPPGTWCSIRVCCSTVREVNPVRFTGIMRTSTLINKVGSVNLTNTIVMNNVACVHGAGANLISVSKILDAGFSIQWKKDRAVIVKDKQLVPLLSTCRRYLHISASD